MTIFYTIRPEDYDTFKSLVTDKEWPETFEEWDAGEREAANKILARGGVVERVVIDAQEFATYDLARRVGHNEYTLGAFAVERNERERRK